MLATLFGNTGRSYKVGELAAASGMSASTAGREVERARTAGVVTVEELGNARLVRANLDHPLAEPLGRILVATFGVPAGIAEEFSDLDGVTSVMVFGSWAARWHGVDGTAPADVDILVAGDPARQDVDDAADRAEARLGQPVQVTVRTRGEWEDRDDAFIREVRSRPLVLVLGAPIHEAPTT
ncbi:ArsR family transcriptional regulator [soil metagenome]